MERIVNVDLVCDQPPAMDEVRRLAAALEIDSGDIVVGAGRLTVPVLGRSKTDAVMDVQRHAQCLRSAVGLVHEVLELLRPGWHIQRAACRPEPATPLPTGASRLAYAAPAADGTPVSVEATPQPGEGGARGVHSRRTHRGVGASVYAALTHGYLQGGATARPAT